METSMDKTKEARAKEIEASLREIEEKDAQAREELRQAMAALREATGEKQDTPDKKNKKEKKAAPKTPGEEINNFIKEFKLKDLLPKAFLLEEQDGGLNEAQKLKVVRDLKRRIVDIVKSDAQTRYSEDLQKKITALSASSGLLNKVTGAAKTFGISAKASLTKERDLKVLEGKVFEEIKSKEENLIKADLELLTQKAQGQKIEVWIKKRKPKEAKDLYPYVLYLDEDSATPEDKKIFKDFNWWANQFAEMAYESGQEKSGKRKNEYKLVKGKYDKAKAKVLEIKGKIENPEFPDKAPKAISEILKIDYAIDMEQLLNTHPEFERALNAFGENAGLKETGKAGWNTLKTATGKNWKNRAAMGVGFFTRTAAKFAPLVVNLSTTAASASTFGVGLGVGAGLGYWRGGERAKDTLAENKKQLRRGNQNEDVEIREKIRVLKEELEKTAPDDERAAEISKKIENLQKQGNEKENVVDAENLNKRLETLIRAYESGHDLTKVTTDLTTGETKTYLGKGDRANQLSLRIAYIQHKIERGLVNFGDSRTALTNQYTLIKNLNDALVIKAGLEEKTNQAVNERLDRFLSYKAKNISEAQKAFIGKQARRGAALGAGFAFAGSALRYVGDHTGLFDYIGKHIPHMGIRTALGEKYNLLTARKFTGESVILKRGDGGIRAISTLQAQIKEHYHGNYAKAPKSVQEFMAEKDPAQIAKKLGFLRQWVIGEKTSENAVIGKNSVLKFDKEGNLSIYDTNSPHPQEQILVGKNGFKDYRNIEDYQGNMQTLEVETSKPLISITGKDGIKRFYLPSGNQELEHIEYPNGVKEYHNGGEVTKIFPDKHEEYYRNGKIYEKYTPDKGWESYDENGNIKVDKPAAKPTATSTNIPKPEASSTATPGSGKGTAELTAEAVKQQPPAPGAGSGNFAGEGITFDHGKGGIQGILDLKAQIRHDYPDISKAPQSVQEFMKADATKEAMRLGFYDPNSPNESALILKGQVLKFDEQGRLLFGQPDASGNIPELEKYQGKMLDTDGSGRRPAVRTMPRHEPVTVPKISEPESESTELPTKNTLKSSVQPDASAADTIPTEATVPKVTPTESAPRTPVQTDAQTETATAPKTAETETSPGPKTVEEARAAVLEKMEAAPKTSPTTDAAGTYRGYNQPTEIPKVGGEEIGTYHGYNQPTNISKTGEEFATYRAYNQPTNVQPTEQKVEGVYHPYNQPTNVQPTEQAVNDANVAGAIDESPPPTLKQILETNPEFAKNHFELTDEKLVEVYEVHKRNLAHLFQGNYSAEWANMKEIPADTILKNDYVPGDPMATYIHRLQEITNLHPREANILDRAETAREYVTRALQKASQMGQLDKVKF